MTGDTHVIVLAAGRGSRLGALGEQRPKWLLEVGGRTIAERQLEAVAQARERAPGGIGATRVVSGHAAAEIERFLEDRPDEGVSTLHNVDYARLNNWYSVLLALRSLDHDPGARVVIVNGDLLAEPDWLAGFIAEAATTDHEALIGVDLGRRLTDESMKVATAEGAPAVVRSIGKVDVEEAVGEYVGLLMARASALAAFRARLEAFVDRPEHVDEWYERAVGLSAADGVGWVVRATPDSAWVEIDDDGDYEAALALVGSG